MNTNSNLQQVPSTAGVAGGEVTREWEQSRKNLATLEQVITNLESRLEPIVAECKQGQGAETSQPEPVRVQFAQSIYDFNIHFNRQTERLSSLLNRIEL